MIRPVTPPADKQILSIAEACGYLGICYNTFRKLLDNGDIRAVRAGRRYLFPKSNIDDFLQRDAMAARLFLRGVK